MPRRRWSMTLWTLWGALASALGPGYTLAEDVPTELDTVVVTATRSPESAFELPAAIDALDEEALHGAGMGISLSEALPAIPGLLARDRQNYAQDTQMSIRGFGARSSFGIRGVRLYLDGIPASQPDGQGQVSHFNIASADRLEVLRGPFSALYGNSSGGVLQLFTADGGDTAEVYAGGALGSFETWRSSLGARGPLGRSADYNLDYTHFDTEGFRAHSAAQRDSFNGKFNYRLSSDAQLSLVLNTLTAPDAQDPLGLTRTQFNNDPTQADTVALDFNTRKSVDQAQGGLIYEQRLGADQTLRAMGYFGGRGIEQFLSVPPGAQASPISSGGVVNLDSDYGGGDLRWTLRNSGHGRPLRLTVGLSYDRLSQRRRGYENFIGDALGVKGALRRDERNDVDNVDEYLQLSWDATRKLLLMAGLRHSQVSFESQDDYVTASNPDDSGKADYSATTPVAGLLYRATPTLHAYAAYGGGFETPTIAELAYAPAGASGLNLDLDAARTRSAEAGIKWRLRPGALAQLALFSAETEHEIVVASNSGGRSTYANADRTRRDGAEFSFRSRLGGQWHTQLAYTWIDARVANTYYTCTGIPCFAPNTPVADGNALPGVPDSSLYGELGWGATTGWNLTVSARYMDAVPVNDVNSESAPSYALFGMEAGYGLTTGRYTLRSFLRVDNLLDEDYVGSVIVNEGNGRFYEPGPGRSVMAGLRLDWRYRS